MKWFAAARATDESLKSVRTFRERRILNAALQFVAAGRHYKGITVPGQMLDYLAALNSSVDELFGAKIEGSSTK